jgi:tetratricopeptide (TPR) repeat protein
MPKRAVSNLLGHSALTDHRILRIPSQSPQVADVTRESPDDLIYHTKPSREPDAAPDLRTLALAYYEVSQLYPTFRQKGFVLLEQAARELPDDADIQAAYGLVLILARPQAPSEASRALQKAIDFGSRSVEVLTRLARLRLREGKTESAIHLYNEAIETDPYYTPAYLGLAYLYTVTEDRQDAIETLERVLKYEPGNETARKAIADAKAGTKE